MVQRTDAATRAIERRARNKELARQYPPRPPVPPKSRNDRKAAAEKREAERRAEIERLCQADGIPSPTWADRRATISAIDMAQGGGGLASLLLARLRFDARDFHPDSPGFAQPHQLMRYTFTARAYLLFVLGMRHPADIADNGSDRVDAASTPEIRQHRNVMRSRLNRALTALQTAGLIKILAKAPAPEQWTENEKLENYAPATDYGDAAPRDRLAIYPEPPPESIPDVCGTSRQAIPLELLVAFGVNQAAILTLMLWRTSVGLSLRLSHANISYFTGLSTQQVRQAMTELLRKGLLIRGEAPIYRTQPNIYTLNETLRLAYPPSEKSHKRHQEFKAKRIEHEQEHEHAERQEQHELALHQARKLVSLQEYQRQEQEDQAAVARMDEQFAKLRQEKQPSLPKHR
jgi:hypothetical protein